MKLKGLVPEPCVKYTLETIEKTEVIDNKRYSIIIKAKPFNALFEADLIVKESGKFEIIGNTIQRISLYFNTADCIKDDLLRNYCYCKKQ